MPPSSGPRGRGDASQTRCSSVSERKPTGVLPARAPSRGGSRLPAASWEQAMGGASPLLEGGNKTCPVGCHCESEGLKGTKVLWR